MLIFSIYHSPEKHQHCSCTSIRFYSLLIDKRASFCEKNFLFLAHHLKHQLNSYTTPTNIMQPIIMMLLHQKVKLNSSAFFYS